MPIRLNFRNFWSSTPDSAIRFFTDLLHTVTGQEVLLTTQSEADITIWSVFGPNGKRNVFDGFDSRKINWYYTGENYEPDVNFFDFSFSFSMSDLKKHFRVPIWWLQCDWKGEFSGTDRLENDFDPYTLHLERNLRLGSKRAVSVFINNPEKRRLAAIESFESHISVEKYGGYFARPVPSKIAVGKEYRYNLCFENESSPGYHTEKLLHAWAMGSVPLYFGNSTVEGEFNPRSFINLNDFSGINEFVAHVLRLTDEELIEIVNAPLLSTPISLEPLRQRIHLEFGKRFSELA
jgi:hypothetical protein